MVKTSININNPSIFQDRELSWLEFNERVLEEATRKSNPPLERLKFLCITESNLDEFYMVRVAGLRNIKLSGMEERSLNGQSTSEIFSEIHKRTEAFVKSQYKILDGLLSELATHRIQIVNTEEDLNSEDITFIKNYYKKDVSSILTPLAIDVSHPFPHLLNKTLNLAIVLYREDDKSQKRELFAIVQVPSVLPRFLKLPSIGDGAQRFFPLEHIIKLHLSDLFYGMKVKEIHPFRIIRDADISIVEEAATGDLLNTMKNELKNRMWGDAVRLDIHEGAGSLRHTLGGLLGLSENEVYEVPSFLNIGDLLFLLNVENTSSMKFTSIPTKSGFPQGASLQSVFSTIRKSEILLHHPYESFSSIEDLLQKAANDSKVFGIKMTLYRTSSDSKILEYLGEAAENGKQVTVLVELKARFDEERNIRWAKKLEDRGVHVVFGFVGLKIHCKMLLIVRREDDRLNRYVHLGTGNYNSTTSRFYTDLSLFTNNPEITEDVATLFNVITSGAKMPKLSRMFAAPLYLKDEFLRLIRQETELARQNKPARIFFKMNSLVDPDVILALYEANNMGVEIDLVIRGICCLKPGIPGISDKIRVRSIIGRFLEHSRIYYFGNNGNPLVYLASADCMPRNFQKRIEVMFPILDQKNKKKILDIMDTYLKDNTQARILDMDGKYTCLSPNDGETPINAQLQMVNMYQDLKEA